jgi:hypothetical protein
MLRRNAQTHCFCVEKNSVFAVDTLSNRDSCVSRSEIPGPARERSEAVGVTSQDRERCLCGRQKK